MKATIALLLSALVLNGCATTPARLPMDAELHPGQSVALPGDARLRYVGTFEDSRCPPDVQCIHAGDAQVRLQLQRAGASKDLTLRASARWPTDADGLRISLLRLTHDAAPVATVRVEQAVP
ncbi:hypothetical protein QLQ15_10295 [Lysobacter sp. LF1]|uniref:Lipoprotein n=1 Tax=Lysobacter stagni TaxID=3045172 RepID=A0ABT6XGK7_9GAMM|nr:hypothetical protein [Lysobacter sp. LF1]MDI9239301.1 hypothetical protein [Lysobacter sp. LF1]